MTNLFINITPGETYKASLERWAERLEKPELQTVYLSSMDVLSVPQILTIFDHIREAFPVSEKAEITLECDPEGVSVLYLRSFYGHGINRLSIARPTCDHLVEGFGFFDSVNVDGRLFEGAQHISRYDIQEFEQFEQTCAILYQKGFIPYDRYHFCRPGFACRYLKNLLHYAPYIGLGPNAHSRFQRDGRWSAMIDGQEGKLLSDQDVLEEYLLQNLGLYEGCDMDQFKAVFDRDLESCFENRQWQSWLEQKQIEILDNRLTLMGAMFFTPEMIVAKLRTEPLQ